MKRTAWSVRARISRVAVCAALSCSALILPRIAAAQTASPQIVEFDPSTDHDAVAGGVALVDRYELRFYILGGLISLHSIDLGKPSPQADGKIRFNFVSLLGTWPLDGVLYEARVAAVGPGGAGLSAPSNQFQFGDTTGPTTCDYSLSVSSRSDDATTATGSVSVTADTGCAWTAQSDASWLTVTSGASGSGNGSVGYAVDANPSTSQRVGHLEIGGQRFTFTQAGAACGYSLSPTSRNIGTAETSGMLGVTAGAGCTWTASSSQSWLTITSGPGGSGNGTIAYTAAANGGSSARTARISLGSVSFTLTQSGSCTYVLAPETRTVAAASTTGSIGVTAGSGCQWSAVSSAGWLSIGSGGNGSGSGTINYSVSANSSSSARTATISVGSEVFTLTQNGACTYTLSPTTRSVGTGTATGSLTVSVGSSCAWTAVSSASWLTLTRGGSGTGGGTIDYSIAANSGSAARSATIKVGAATFTVTQSGSCVVTISPATQTFNAASATGSVSVAVSSGCTWSASRSGSWITITSGTSGNGNGTVRYRVSANTGSLSRTGTLTVAGKPITITQYSNAVPGVPGGLRIIK